MNRENSTSSFLIWVSFITFSWLTVPGMTLSTLLLCWIKEVKAKKKKKKKKEVADVETVRKRMSSLLATHKKRDTALIWRRKKKTNFSSLFAWGKTVWTCSQVVWKSTSFFQGSQDTGPEKYTLVMVRNDDVHVLDVFAASRLSRYKKCQQTVSLELLGFHVNAMELPYLKYQSH